MYIKKTTCYWLLTKIIENALYSIYVLKRPPIKFCNALLKGL